MRTRLKHASRRCAGTPSGVLLDPGPLRRDRLAMGFGDEPRPHRGRGVAEGGVPLATGIGLMGPPEPFLPTTPIAPAHSFIH